LPFLGGIENLGKFLSRRNYYVNKYGVCSFEDASGAVFFGPLRKIKIMRFIGLWQQLRNIFALPFNFLPILRTPGGNNLFQGRFADIGMAKLWQRSHTPKVGQELIEVDLLKLRIDRPTVIFLPGIFTTNGKKQHNVENIAEIEALLKTPAGQMPDIYALSYDDLSTIFNICAYNGRPDKAFCKAAQRMAEAVILPLVVKNGKPLPEEEAAKNLRNLTLVGYSAGSVFAQEMYNAAVDLMKRAGWKEDRARQVMGETVLISMASVSRPSREKDRFTTLYLAASNDLAVRLKNRIWRPISRLFGGHSDELSIRRPSRSSLLITATTGRDMWQWRDSPDGSKIRAAIEPLLPPPFRSHHEPAHYMTCDDDHNEFSKIVRNGLVQAVKRDRRLDVTELLEPVDEKGAAHYRARIQRALRLGERKDNRQQRRKNVPKAARHSGFHDAASRRPRPPGFGPAGPGTAPA
jgi:hypothetical protein